MSQKSLSRSLFTTTAILAGSSAALLMGGIARADTAPAPNPGLPGISAIEQLANVPAMAPQLLQDAAASLTGTAKTPAPATVPGASANVTLPQTVMPQTIPGQTVPGQIVPGQPTTVTNPGLTDQLVPNTQVKLPNVPGLPLPQQLSVPGDLAGLLPVAITNPVQAVTPSVAPGLSPTAVPGLAPTAVTGLAPAVAPAISPATVAGPAALVPATGLVPDLSALIPLSALP